MPLLMTFFVISIGLLCICLLVTASTLFLYHCPVYEARNFSRTEARISRAIAEVGLHIDVSKQLQYWVKSCHHSFAIPYKFFTKIACGMWNIEVPENTNMIADKGDEELVEVEHLQLGMKFYADMIDRLFFAIITVTIVITFFCTFVRSWIKYATFEWEEILSE